MNHLSLRALEFAARHRRCVKKRYVQVPPARRTVATPYAKDLAVRYAPPSPITEAFSPALPIQPKSIWRTKISRFSPVRWVRGVSICGQTKRGTSDLFTAVPSTASVSFHSIMLVEELLDRGWSPLFSPLIFPNNCHLAAPSYSSSNSMTISARSSESISFLFDLRGNLTTTGSAWRRCGGRVRRPVPGHRRSAGWRRGECLLYSRARPCE